MSLPADLRFADPWVLALLALLPTLFLLARRRQANRRPGGVVLSTLTPLAGVGPGTRVRLRPLLGVLRPLAFALLIVGLARPQSAEAHARIRTEGIDIVLVLDVSGSMGDPGLEAPTKLTAAKQALKHFLGTRHDDRIGFVVFKSESKQVSPLTTDHQALAQLVDVADKQGANLAEGTAIGLGLADALNLLRNSRARSRVIILATDGENNVTTVTPEQAGKIAETLKVTVYTIGIPTRGERPELSLDEKRLARIAEGTGGSYSRAANAPGLADTYTRIATLEKSRIERDRFTRYTELAPWPLTAAFVLVTLELLAGATVFRRAP